MATWTKYRAKPHAGSTVEDRDLAKLRALIGPGVEIVEVEVTEGTVTVLEPLPAPSLTREETTITEVEKGPARE
jgi:hypothetical protein